MDTPRNRWFYYIGSFFLVLAIPLTVYLVQQQQDIRQRAQEGTSPASQETIFYPWDNPRSGQKIIPVVDASKKAIFTQLPFSSKNCEKKKDGDADCNNSINLADLSYWQIDYEKGTSRYADFNGDGKVTLTDYNIWRQHANFPSVPLVQKLSQKLGLEKLFAQTIWNFTPKITRVFAKEMGLSTVTESSVIIGSDEYRIMNQYADQTYSIEEIEHDSNGGQITYYGNNGQQIAQVSNFVADNSTMTTNVGGANVAVNRNEQGVIAQTSKDANGAFIANQIWADTAAYAQNAAPQAATLPTSSGFATLSNQPNSAAILTQRDSNGTVTSNSVIENTGMIHTVDYQKSMLVMADASLGLSNVNIRTRSGSASLIFHRKQLISAINKNRVSGAVQTAFLESGNTWKFTSYNAKGEQISEKTIADITKESDPDFPELLTVIQTAKSYKVPKSTKGFVQAFKEGDNIKGPAAAADTLVVVNSQAQAVLGAKTNNLSSPTKSVLGTVVGVVPETTGKTDNGDGYSATFGVYSVTGEFPANAAGIASQGTRTETVSITLNEKGSDAFNAGQYGTVTVAGPAGQNAHQVDITSRSLYDQLSAAREADPNGVIPHGVVQTAVRGAQEIDPTLQSITSPPDSLGNPANQSEQQPQQQAVQVPAGSKEAFTQSNGAIVGLNATGRVNNVSNGFKDESGRAYHLEFKSGLPGEGASWSREYGVRGTTHSNLSQADRDAINAAIKEAVATGKPVDQQIGFSGTTQVVGKEIDGVSTTGNAPASLPGAVAPGSAGNLTAETAAGIARAAVNALGARATGNPALAAQTAAVAVLAAGGPMAQQQAMDLARSYAIEYGATSEQRAAAVATASFLSSNTGHSLVEELGAWGVDINENLAEQTGQGLEGINEGIATDAAMGASYASVEATYAAFDAIRDDPASTQEQIDAAYGDFNLSVQGFTDVARESGYNDSSINDAISQATGEEFGGDGGGGDQEVSASVSESIGSSNNPDQTIDQSSNDQGSLDSNSNNDQY